MGLNNGKSKLLTQFSVSACFLLSSAVIKLSLVAATVRSVKEDKRNPTIKVLQLLDTAKSKGPVTGYELLFSDRRTFIFS